MNPTYCPWESPAFLFISSNVPLLINYSHFIAIFSVLIISFLIFFNNPKAIVSKLFLLFASLFSLWTLLDVGLWATNDPSIVMFSWSLQVLIEPVLYATAFFLFYTYIHKKLPKLEYQLISAVILLPLLIFLPTTLNLEGLLLSSCESIEGPIAKYYTYFANLLFILMIILIGIKNIPSLKKDQKKSTILFLVGLATFLLAFTSGNIISSFTDDWTLSQYGLFGMPVFSSIIGYSIVKFNSFRIPINGVQALVIVLWTLVASLLFVDRELVIIIVLITLFFTTIAGYILIKNVSKEIKQREEIEKLAKKITKANKRLKELDQMKSEFVSIASHQLRSPLTSIRGYTSMLIEGSYGKLPPKALEAIERILDSSTYMASSIEDYLNVSRIEAGNMKYEMSDFNIKEEASHTVDDKRQEAIKKGLVLQFKSDIDQAGIINADVGKTRQILHNLINNALKYTPKGTVTVFVHDNTKKKEIYVDIIDSGIGMKSDELEDIFGKFERAHNANQTNVTGTGLGLFVARKMAREMHGDIVAFSDGPGKGSTFRLTMPLQM